MERSKWNVHFYCFYFICGTFSNPSWSKGQRLGDLKHKTEFEGGWIESGSWPGDWSRTSIRRIWTIVFKIQVKLVMLSLYTWKQEFIIWENKTQGLEEKKNMRERYAHEFVYWLLGEVMDYMPAVQNGILPLRARLCPTSKHNCLEEDGDVSVRRLVLQEVLLPVTLTLLELTFQTLALTGYFSL